MISVAPGVGAENAVTPCGLLILVYRPPLGVPVQGQRLWQQQAELTVPTAVDKRGRHGLCTRWPAYTEGLAPVTTAGAALRLG
jgi:hypothetical protein